jgi:hypothetical protein
MALATGATTIKAAILKRALIVRVRFVERVPVLAVRHPAAIPTAMLTPRYCQQMGRTHTPFMLTEMVQLLPVTHGAIGEFVGDPMRCHRLIAEAKASVAIGSPGAAPFPAIAV